jgi:type I restriction enzyme S subunit
MMQELQERTKQLIVDKSTWISYRFDEIADSISKRVEPHETELGIYVGLEHLDSESVHIRRWGKPSDVEGTKLKFFKGDVIFGKRRAYQRKAAVAEFDGICSAHAMVLRANSSVILPELFPFFLHSDTFMNRAIDISVGSLSPTINWGTLKHQEFLLPPLDQQARLAELLWAADEVIEKYDLLYTEILKSKNVVLRNKFQSIDKIKDSSIDVLGNIGNWISGSTPSTSIKEYWSEKDYMWVTPKDVKSNLIQSTEDYLTFRAIQDIKVKVFAKGSFTVVWRSGILQHSFPVARIENDFTINQDMKAFIPDPELVFSEYVRYFLETFEKELLDKCVKSGTTVQSINTESFLRFPIPVPQKSSQQQLIQIAFSFDQSITDIENCRFRSKQARRELSNQIF